MRNNNAGLCYTIFMIPLISQKSVECSNWERYQYYCRITYPYSYQVSLCFYLSWSGTDEKSTGGHGGSLVNACISEPVSQLPTDQIHLICVQNVHNYIIRFFSPFPYKSKTLQDIIITVETTDLIMSTCWWEELTFIKNIWREAEHFRENRKRVFGDLQLRLSWLQSLQ